jgi:hypothetical protein
MPRWRAPSETIHLIALALWLGTLVMTGAAAAVIFPVMKSLNPALPGYAAYSGEHWRIAGGQIASRLFFICDTIQFGAGIIAAVTLGVLLFVARVPALRPAMILRMVALIAALGILGYQFFFFFPTFNSNMTQYWAAAQRGDNTAAATFKAAFDRAHPTVTILLASSTISVFLALTAGAWTAATPERNIAPSLAPRLAAEPPKQRLEEPLLLRARR